MTAQTIGFIGTGVMGSSMAGHLIEGGYELLVYNRTKSKARELTNKSAKWCETIKELAVLSDIVITIVGYPTDVEDIYFNEDGILKNAKAGSYLIDMTTSTPSLAKRIADDAMARGMYFLDAPVSGGDIGAKDATLVIMVGGEEEAYHSVMPVFELMGTNITLQGPPGSGQYTKMANQIVIASTMMGVAEGMAYAKKAGLNQENVLKAIETGAAGSFALSKLAPRMIKRDYAPGFYIKHFIKDMNIAIQSAEEIGLETPGLQQAKALYEKLASMGEEDSGTQAIYKLYES